MANEPGADMRVTLKSVPEDVVSIAETLAAAGHTAFLVGGSVRDLLRGIEPTEFQLLTNALPEQTVDLFPRAVPTHAVHGIVMLPRAGGPVDIVPMLHETLEAELAHRDFTLNAIAYDPCSRVIIDPFEGRADWMKGRLQGVGSAAERLAEDPLRAMRAARFVATLDLEAEPQLEQAMAAVAPRVPTIPATRLRWEFCTLILAPGATRGLELLYRTGIAGQLAPNTAKSAPGVVGLLPADLEVRLAGWLRGTRALRTLRQMRFPRTTSGRVEHLLNWHPIEGHALPEREASLRRLLKRAGARAVASLIALRRAELEVEANPVGKDVSALRERLNRIEAAIERLLQEGTVTCQRTRLAIDGAFVMKILGTGPGPVVGQALRYLTKRATEDPNLNSEETLRSLLVAWDAEKGETS